MGIRWYEHVCPYHGMSTQNDFSLGFLTRSCFDSPPFCGLLTGWQVSEGTLVEGTVYYHNRNDFSKSLRIMSDLNDYSYCSITDAAQVQFGRVTVAFKWAAHYLAKYFLGTWLVPLMYLTSTCQILAGYLSGTCRVLFMYLPATCQVPVSYLAGTFWRLVRYLTCLSQARWIQCCTVCAAAKLIGQQARLSKCWQNSNPPTDRWLASVKSFKLQPLFNTHDNSASHSSCWQLAADRMVSWFTDWPSANCLVSLLSLLSLVRAAVHREGPWGWHALHPWSVDGSLCSNSPETKRPVEKMFSFETECKETSWENVLLRLNAKGPIEYILSFETICKMVKFTNHISDWGKGSTELSWKLINFYSSVISICNMFEMIICK